MSRLHRGRPGKRESHRAGFGVKDPGLYQRGVENRPKDGDSESAAIWEQAFDNALTKAITELSEAIKS